MFVSRPVLRSSFLQRHATVLARIRTILNLRHAIVLPLVILVKTGHCDDRWSGARYGTCFVRLRLSDMLPLVLFLFLVVQEKDQEAFRRRYFWAYDTTPDGEGNNATSTKLLILPNGEMMSVERRAKMDAACADRPKIGDHRPNQVRHASFERRTSPWGAVVRSSACKCPGGCIVWEPLCSFCSQKQCRFRFLGGTSQSRGRTLLEIAVNTHQSLVWHYCGGRYRHSSLTGFEEARALLSVSVSQLVARRVAAVGERAHTLIFFFQPLLCSCFAAGGDMET